MSYETLLFDCGDNGVATITLNRPHRMNAFNRTMANEFRDIWSRIRQDSAVRAVVLRAAGERAFCTGVDVKEGWVDKAAGPFDQIDPGTHLGPKQNQVWKPVICAVHGMAAGGAFYWLNESDVIICSEEAEFFDPHVTYGQVSACEPIGMLGRLPYLEIMRLVLMGNEERICAATALRISLVTEVVARDLLWARAEEIAAAIARKPAAAIQGSVRALWESRNLPQSLAVELGLKYTQIGNPIGKAEVNRAAVDNSTWRRR